MKKLGLAVALIACATAQSAFADNLAGAFVGAQVGEARNATKQDDNDGWYNDIKGVETTDAALSYALRGGFNWQSGDMVYGVLAEYVIADLDTVQESSPASPTYYIGSQTDALASLRGRVGLTSGKLAVLASAGLAYMDGTNRMGDTDGSFETIAMDAESNGYVLGLSAEYALNEKAVIALDLSRYTFDDSTEEVMDAGVPQGYTFTFKNEATVIGVSYNYKF